MRGACLSPSEVGARAPFPLTPLDLATGLVWGGLPERPRVPQGTETLRQAVEGAVRDAFECGPVAVSFSGGRDSSAVLAVAAHVAAAGGWRPPLPVTLVYPDEPASDEADWQDLVLQHLGLRERIVLEVHDELDLLGETATGALRAHGLLWPANGFSHARMLQECAGMTLLTGGGGDELFDDSAPSRSSLVLAGRAVPRPRDVLRLAASRLAPRAYDARRARYVLRLPWLSGEGQQRFAAAVVDDRGRPGQPWDASALRALVARSFAAMRAGQDLLADERRARIRHPFLEPRVVAAAARAGGRLGLGGRTRAMRLIAGDLLPSAVIERTTKATFDGGYWSRESLEFGGAIDVEAVLGADPALGPLLDLGALAAAWRDPRPPFLTALLLQACWLADDRGA